MRFALSLCVCVCENFSLISFLVKCVNFIVDEILEGFDVKTRFTCIFSQAGKLGYKRAGHCSQVRRRDGPKFPSITSLITRYLHLYLNFDKYTKLLHETVMHITAYIILSYQRLFKSIIRFVVIQNRAIVRDLFRLSLIRHLN